MTVWIPPSEYMPNGRKPPVLAPDHILSLEKLYLYKENDEEIDDGREEKLLEYIITHPSSSQLQGNPEAVVNTIDEFAQSRDFLMTVGPLKRKTVKAVMAHMDPKPKVVLELGAYIGYTALGLASILRELRADDSAKVFSFELEPKWASITRRLAQFAGVEDMVNICIGKADESLKNLIADGILEQGTVDVVLLDHWEDRYLPDLQCIEAAGLLHEGSVIFADNVFFPGAPQYLNHVRNTKQEDRKILYMSHEEQSMMPNGWKVSVKTMFVKHGNNNLLGLNGN